MLALAGASAGADKKPKPPDIEVLEASAHRGEARISVDGRVRNSGEKPIKELTLLFHFMAPGKQVVTTQKGRIEEEVLGGGAGSCVPYGTECPTALGMGGLVQSPAG